VKKDKSAYVPRLQLQYESLVDGLKTELGVSNIHQVPKFEKIVVNIGQGQATQNIKILEAAVKELEKITGQKAIMTRAKKSIATFKLREGMPIGCAVTLRKHKMYEFLDRLINVSIPRIRDFRGLSAKAFDGNGNYTLGIKEQIIFPEIEYDKIDKLRGVGITIVTNSRSDAHARALLDKFNFPFRRT
jgi:large subunit ribosomal protein L5